MKTFALQCPKKKNTTESIYIHCEREMERYSKRERESEREKLRSAVASLRHILNSAGVNCADSEVGGETRGPFGDKGCLAGR